MSQAQINIKDKVAVTNNEVSELVGFDYSYKGDKLKVRVAEILNLPETTSWSIVDSEGSLALVHYEENKTGSKNFEDVDMETYGHLRGILVDTETGAILMNSFGYTPTVISDKIEITEGKIALTDKKDKVHVYDPESTIIKRVYEGVVMRVIWYNGKCYKSTHRKINPCRSRWGSSPSFLDMYTEAGGPSEEELFDTTKPYSDSCYVFLICHPKLLVGTRQNINKPYIVCLAHYVMDVKKETHLVAKGKDSFKRITVAPSIIDESMILQPENLTLDEANNHLVCGYHNTEEVFADNRKQTGEAVILYEMKDGKAERAIKIHSSSYDWRVEMRGNDSNIPHRFYCLIDKMYEAHELKSNSSSCGIDVNSKLKETVVIYPKYSIDDFFSRVEEDNGILFLSDESDELVDYSTMSKEDKVYLLWMNYVISLPPSLQKEALPLFNKYITSKNSLVDVLFDVANGKYGTVIAQKQPRAKPIQIQPGTKPPTPFPFRASKIIDDAKISADQECGPKNGKKRLNINHIVRRNINNFINKEKGASLYSLSRDISRWKENQSL